MTFNKEKRLIDEVHEDPWGVIRGVFENNSRDLFQEALRQWLCVTLKLGKHPYQEAEQQTRLVFFYDQMLLFIDALFFIIDSREPEALFLRDFKKAVTGDIIPPAINTKQKEPTSVITDFFVLFTMEYIRAELWDWFTTVLVAGNDLEYNQKDAICWMYEYCIALVEAASALHLRKEMNEPGKLDDPIQQDANREAGSAALPPNSIAEASAIDNFLINPDGYGDHMRAVLTKVVEVCQPDKIFLLSNYIFFESPVIIIDLLVLVPEPVSKEMSRSYQQQIESALAPTAWVICAIDHTARVYRLFEQGHIFFSRVCRKEHLVYDNGKAPLPSRGEVRPGPIIENARRVFYSSFEKAEGFLEAAHYFNGKSNRPMATFQLNQATQLMLSGFLTALTGYQYMTRDIARLLRLTFRITNQLNVFGLHVEDQKRILGLLNNAYVKVHHGDGFAISESDMGLLFERVDQLVKAAQKELDARLESFRYWH